MGPSSPGEESHGPEEGGPLWYLAAFGLAVVSVPACLAMNLALALFFALPPRYHLIGSRCLKR